MNLNELNEYLMQFIIAGFLTMSGWCIQMFKNNKKRLLHVEHEVKDLKSKSDKDITVLDVKLTAVCEGVNDIKDTLKLLVEKHMK